MAPNPRRQPQNTGSGSGLARGMLPMGKPGLGPGGRFMLLLRGKSVASRLVYREHRMDRNLVRGILRAACVAVLFLISMHVAFAETGAEAWLRYSQVKDGAASLPTRVAVVGNSAIV